MAYEGKGDMKKFVSTWNVAISAMKNPVVVQKYVMGTPASITVSNKKLTISFR